MADEIARSKSSSLPYLCRVCRKRFRRLNFLQAHVRMHTGNRPYHCDCCTLTFISQCLLRDHQHKSHPDRRPYRCPTCKLGFVRVSAMNWHMFREHRTINLNTVKATSPINLGNDVIVQESSIKSINYNIKEMETSKNVRESSNCNVHDEELESKVNYSHILSCDESKMSSDQIHSEVQKKSAIERLKAYRPQFGKKIEDQSVKSVSLGLKQEVAIYDTSQCIAVAKDTKTNFVIDSGQEKCPLFSAMPTKFLPCSSEGKSVFRSQRQQSTGNLNSSANEASGLKNSCCDGSLHFRSSQGHQERCLASSPHKVKTLKRAEQHNHDHNKNCYAGSTVEQTGTPRHSCNGSENDQYSSSHSTEDKWVDPLMVRTGMVAPVSRHQSCDSKQLSPRSCTSSSPASPGSSRGPNSPRQSVSSQASPHGYFDMLICSSSKPHQSPSSLGQSPCGFSACERPREVMSITMSTVGNSPSAYSTESAEIDGKVPSPHYVSGSESLSTAGSPYSVADKGTGISPQYFENQIAQLGPSGNISEWKPVEKPIQSSSKPSGSGGFNFLNEFAKFVQNFDNAAINSAPVQGDTSSEPLTSQLNPPLLIRETETFRSGLGSRIINRRKFRSMSTFYMSKRARKMKKKFLEPRKGTRVSPRNKKLATPTNECEVKSPECLVENATAIPMERNVRNGVLSSRVGRAKKSQQFEKSDALVTKHGASKNISPASGDVNSQAPARLEKHRNSVSPPELEPVDLGFHSKVNSRFKEVFQAYKLKGHGRARKREKGRPSCLKRRRLSSDSTPPKLPIMVRSGSTESSASSAPPQLTREEPSKASIYDFEDMSSEDHLPPPRLKLKLSPRRSLGWESTLKPPSLNMFKRSLSDPNGNTSISMPNLEAKPSSPRSPKSPRRPPRDTWQRTEEILDSAAPKCKSPRTPEKDLYTLGNLHKLSGKASQRTPPKDCYIPTVKLRRRNSSGHYVVVNEDEMYLGECHDDKGYGCRVGQTPMGDEKTLKVCDQGCSVAKKCANKSLFRPPLCSARKSKSPDSAVMFSKSPIVVLTKSPEGKMANISSLPQSSANESATSNTKLLCSSIGSGTSGSPGIIPGVTGSKVPVVCLIKSPLKDSLIEIKDYKPICSLDKKKKAQKVASSKSLRSSSLRSGEKLGEESEVPNKCEEMEANLSISELLDSVADGWSKVDDRFDLSNESLIPSANVNMCKAVSPMSNSESTLNCSTLVMDKSSNPECVINSITDDRCDPKFSEELPVSGKAVEKPKYFEEDGGKIEIMASQSLTSELDTDGAQQNRHALSKGESEPRGKGLKPCRKSHLKSLKTFVGIKHVYGNASSCNKLCNGQKSVKWNKRISSLHSVNNSGGSGNASGNLLCKTTLSNLHVSSAANLSQVSKVDPDVNHISDFQKKKPIPCSVSENLCDITTGGPCDKTLNCVSNSHPSNKERSCFEDPKCTVSDDIRLSSRKSGVSCEKEMGRKHSSNAAVCSVEVEDIFSKEKSPRVVTSVLQRYKCIDNVSGENMSSATMQGLDQVTVKLEPVTFGTSPSNPSKPAQDVVKADESIESVPMNSRSQPPSVDGKYSLRPKRNRHPWDVTCECCLGAISRKTKRRINVKSFVQNSNKVLGLRNKVCRLLKTLFPDLLYPIRFSGHTHAVEALMDKVIQAAQDDTWSSDSDSDNEDSSDHVVSWEPQVVLCKSPRNCLHQLRRKVCRLVEVLLPEVRLDSGFDQHGDVVDDLLEWIIEENAEQDNCEIPLTEPVLSPRSDHPSTIELRSKELLNTSGDFDVIILDPTAAILKDGLHCQKTVETLPSQVGSSVKQEPKS